MTQHELAIKYCVINGSIIPAKVGGTELFDENVSLGFMGSEITKRCRELCDPNSPSNPYKKKILDRKPRTGKFTEFYLVGLPDQSAPTINNQSTMFNSPQHD